jgi:histone-lysine N-methyltransferase SETDB1
MVKLQRGQTIKTELNGYWFNGRVDKVDASMASIYFAPENRFEWIYRGSTRFRHLYDLLANEEARKKQGDRRPSRPIHNMSLVHKKKNAPYVEYTCGNTDVHDAPSVPATPPLLKSQSAEVILKSFHDLPIDVGFSIIPLFRMVSDLSPERALPESLNHQPAFQP